MENLVVNPEFLGEGAWPDCWEYWSPRPELALAHAASSAAAISLQLAATGDRRAFGCWRGKSRLETGRWYRASVKARIEGIECPELSLFAHVAQHFLIPTGSSEGTLVFERTFRHARAEDGTDIELYLRAAEKGRVEWYDPQVVEVGEPKRRLVKTAAVRFGNPTRALAPEAQVTRIAEKLDLAGSIGSDIVCLPEMSPFIGTGIHDKRCLDLAEQVPNGPVCRLLASKAKEHYMYVIAGILEKRGRYVFNTAVLFGRDGSFIGQYDKTHLTFGELRMGLSCGDSYPVFDLDFGRIAIHICYDQWFPEVARYYVHRGAEILFLPVAGGKPIIWRTRALDCGIYFVSASITPPSMIIDSSGAIIAETHDDGVASADLDLNYRRVNWYEDPTLAYGMPCIWPQMRNVLDHYLIERLCSEMLRSAVGNDENPER